MEKLIVLSEGGVSQEFPLMGQRISIGRDEQNHICLGDKSVSRHHATVQRVFKGFTLQDEGSTNGTRVNGRVISKQYLKHRDLIEIGKYHLRFVETSSEVGEEDEDEDEDTDRTTVIRSIHQPEQAVRPTHQSELAGRVNPQAESAVRPTHQSRLAPSSEKPQPARPPYSVPVSKPAPKAVAEQATETDQTPESALEDENAAKIRFLAGEQLGKEVVVNKAFFSVGNPGGDLVLINRRDAGYFLLKVGGDVPPRINGTPIKAGGVELHDGDRIELGELVLEFMN